MSEALTKVRHNKPAHLWIDQWGNRFWARSRKKLVAAVGGGAVSIMYCDKLDGRTVRTGYVVGRHWLTEFAPVERAA